MHILSHIMLVGALVLLTHSKGCDAYTLDRKVTDADESLEATTADSLETTTDNDLDSIESTNPISTEDNSLEAEKRLVKRNVQPAVSSIVDYDYHDSIETTTVDDGLADNVSLEDILKLQTTVAAVPMQTTTPDDDLVDDLVNSMEKNATSTEDLFDVHNDTSLESNDHLNAPAVTLPSLSILSHLPVIGVFSHPASDDLYLSKQYLGDYYLWEMGDDSARDYFLQTVKDTKKFDFDSPIKVDAVQFNQFTPVRSLPADRLETHTTVL